MKTCYLSAGILTLLALCRPSIASPPERHRSPIDLAVLPGDRFALTANHTSDSVSLLDLEKGQVVAEERCGQKPAAVACSRDGKRLAVSELWSGTVSFFEMQPTTLKPAGQARVGPFPRGLVFAADGRSLYIAVAGNEEVVQLDCDSKRIIHHWPAPRTETDRPVGRRALVGSRQQPLRRGSVLGYRHSAAPLAATH